MKSILLFISCIILAQTTYAENKLLNITYLTFETEDTSHNITVNYHSLGKNNSSSVMYDIQSCDLKNCSYSYTSAGKTNRIKKINKTYHNVQLNNLKPNTVYFFRTGTKETGISKEFKFRILPNDNRPITILNGGDMGISRDIPKIAKPIVSQDPDLIVLGGDIAYANGKIKDEDLWVKWFAKMETVWETPNGFLIPIIVAMGNHESRLGFGGNKSHSPFYFNYFPQGGKSYFLRKLNSETVLFILDTGHMHSHNREQLSWLDKKLNTYQNYNHKIASYHIPLYPSVRSFNGIYSRKGRKYWGPLFDKYNLSLALEHHDHALKRTYPLTKSKSSTKGTVYLGDGCFGKSTRGIASNRKYIAKSLSQKHAWMLNVSNDYIEAKAYGLNEKLLDHVQINQTSNATFVKDMLSK